MWKKCKGNFTGLHPDEDIKYKSERCPLCSMCTNSTGLCWMVTEGANQPANAAMALISEWMCNSASTPHKLVAELALKNRVLKKVYLAHPRLFTGNWEIMPHAGRRDAIHPKQARRQHLHQRGQRQRPGRGDRGCTGQCPGEGVHVEIGDVLFHLAPQMSFAKNQL